MLVRCLVGRCDGWSVTHLLFWRFPGSFAPAQSHPTYFAIYPTLSLSRYTKRCSPQIEDVVRCGQKWNEMGPNVHHLIVRCYAVFNTFEHRWRWWTISTEDKNREICKWICPRFTVHLRSESLFWYSIQNKSCIWREDMWLFEVWWDFVKFISSKGPQIPSCYVMERRMSDHFAWIHELIEGAEKVGNRECGQA